MRGKTEDLKTLQNQTLDLKTFRDRFLLSLELFLLLDAKIDKKQATNQVNCRNDFGCDFGRFYDNVGSNRGRPGGMREAVGGLNSLTESDKSCYDVL